MFFRQFNNKIPINTIKTWQSQIMASSQWKPCGWTGQARQPFRHWACYPQFDGGIKQIWQCLVYDLKQQLPDLLVDRVILNLYNHGDSSWIHRDSLQKDRYTVILYCNTNWDINWAGQTVLVQNNEVVKSFSPTPGKFIVFDSRWQHGARPISRQAPFPRLGVTFQCTKRIKV